MNSSSRRALLRTGALAAVSLAGCLGSDPESVDLELGDTRRDHDGNVRTIDAVWVQSSFFHHQGGGGWYVGATEGTQFVFADGMLSADRTYRLELNGKRYPAKRSLVEIPNDEILFRGGRDVEYYEPRFLVFEVPRAVDAEESVFVMEQDDGPEFRWRLPHDSGVPDLLADPPRFDVRSFEAPEAVSADGGTPLSVTVERVAGRSEPFRAGITMGDPVAAGGHLRLDLPAGTEHTWTGEYGNVGEPDDTLDYTLDWGLGSLTETVVLE